MKILHTADWHVGRTVRGRNRIEEHEAALGELARVARREEVDLVLVAGDLFDSGTPPPEAERVVYGTLLALAEVAPVVVVAGNHDSDRRLAALEPVLARVGVVTRADFRGGRERLVVEHHSRSGERARVACLPFLSQRYVVRALDVMALELGEAVQRYDDRVRRIVEALTDDMDGSAVNVLVGHVMVAGGEPGGGERPVHLGEEYAVSPAAFGPQLSYVALGHLHRTQRIPGACPIWYAGAPLQLDFGEGENEPGALLVEARPSLPAEVRPVLLTGGRRMLTLRGTLDELRDLAPGPGGAWLRVVVRGERRAGLADEVHDLFPNAVEVRVEVPAAPVRQRPERQGRTPGELFRGYLTERGSADERLASLFDELYEEVLAAERAGPGAGDEAEPVRPEPPAGHGGEGTQQARPARGRQRRARGRG